ncbi:hypothetical protein BDV93DRAFT_609693 [Ceratobasidium sp. AG-I]|nr:hypothetical protein BDV93DRAFT_609693 [Ceratobasidium sp. AG-I]
MPSNSSVDDYSPLIQYDGQWLDSFNLSGDPFTSHYKDSSFHSSKTNNSKATFEFKGIGVYIFGAKRGNHGYYQVAIDDEPAQQFDGFAPTQPDGTDGVYQYPLYSKAGLKDGTHKVTLTNIVNGDRPYVDIDFIIWTRKSDVSFNHEIVGDLRFEYSGPATDWSTRNSDQFQGKSAHTTTAYGAAAALSFDGSEIFLYGGIGPDHGTFKIQLDDQPAIILNGTSPISHPNALLYTTSGLSDDTHRLVITNNEEGKVMDVDYVDLVPHSKSGLSPGAIAGIIVGGVVGLAILVVTLWYFFIFKRRRNNRRFSTDLLDNSPTTEGETMRTYSSGHNPLIVEPYTDRSPQPTTTDLSSTDVRTDEGHGHRKGVVVGRGQGERVNRNEGGLWPGMGASEGGSSGSRTHETDAGALPPVYDQIVPDKIAEVPVQSRA